MTTTERAVTKAELDAAVGEILKDIHELDTRLSGRIDRVEGRLSSVENHLRGVEGRLSAIESRLIAHEAELSNLVSLVGNVSEISTKLVDIVVKQGSDLHKLQDGQTRLFQLIRSE